MDPSRCANPSVFKTPENSHDARNDLEIIEGEGIEERLKGAARLAIEEHKENNSQPLLPIIIENDREATITVSLVDDYLVISRGIDRGDISIPNDRFQHIHFLNLVDCRVFVSAKLVRVYFYNCDNCQVSMRSPLIKGLEFYKCNNINLSTRVPEPDTIGEPIVSAIPMTEIESCQTFHIYQSNTELMYLIKTCGNIKGVIVDRLTGHRYSEHQLGKLFWDEQERILVCLSKTLGFISVPVKYALNDLAQHMMVDPLDSSDTFDFDNDDQSLVDIFGSTPPTRGFLSGGFRR